MSGYQPMSPPRPVFQRGRPPTPVVPIERCRPVVRVEPVTRLPAAAPPQKKEVAAPEVRALQAHRTARRISLLVAHRHGVSWTRMMGHRRTVILVRARHEAMAEVAKALPAWSTTRIGRFFGRDHTTVLHALAKMGVKR